MNEEIPVSLNDKVINEPEEFIMDFYDIDKDILDQYYQDELDSLKQILNRMKKMLDIS